MSSRSLSIALTALAPLIWGSTYYVTTAFLPPDRPLTAAMLRVLPAGLLLLLWTREWPKQAAEWGKTLVLGALNIGFFQAMLFVAAYRLPGGLAAILSSTQTLVVLLLMALAGSRPPQAAWRAAGLGVLGVILLVASPQTRFDTLGIVAALAGAVSMAAGVFLAKRWQIKLSVLALTGWQLLLGGLCLLPVAGWHRPVAVRHTAAVSAGTDPPVAGAAAVTTPVFFAVHGPGFARPATRTLKLKLSDRCAGLLVPACGLPQLPCYSCLCPGLCRHGGSFTPLLRWRNTMNPVV